MIIMSEQKYCSNCGAPLTGDAAFCSKCGRAVATVVPTSPPPPHRRDEKYEEKRARGEKGEKQGQQGEKGEKGEKYEKHGRGGWIAGAFAGLIIIWLGISLALSTTNFLINWWPYFLMGLGVILIIEGLILAVMRNRFYPFIGFFIGGAIVFVIGIAGAYSLYNWWPYFFVLIGILIILIAIFGRRRAPRP